MAPRAQAGAARLRSLAAGATLPLALLAAVSVLSLAGRLVLLGQPCRKPCRSAADHMLIFDESYYVNAARVIAGLRPPAGATYADAPAGDDPNAEHPQLAKLVIAGSIELLGDRPLAWRLGSLLLGSLAILGMFVLVRAAGGSRWLALGAATLLAADNLALVHGRIGTLDMYALAAMIWGVALYLRGRPILAGAVIGVGACTKLLAPYALLVIALLELIRALRDRNTGLRAPLIRLAGCVLSAAAVFIGLLALLDRIAPPYDPVTRKLVTGGPFAHLTHMLRYAAGQTSPSGPHGIASYPWQWLWDYKPIVYLNINPGHPAHGLSRIHPEAHFLGMASPAIMLLGVPALLVAAVSLWRAPARVAARAGGVGGAARADAGAELDALSLAWFLGTWGPFVLLSLFWNRTSYLYYVLLVLPGVYVAVARLVARAAPHRRLRALVVIWALAVLIAVVLMYPFTPLP